MVVNVNSDNISCNSISITKDNQPLNSYIGNIHLIVINTRADIIHIAGNENVLVTLDVVSNNNILYFGIYSEPKDISIIFTNLANQLVDFKDIEYNGNYQQFYVGGNFDKDRKCLIKCYTEKFMKNRKKWFTYYDDIKSKQIISKLRNPNFYERFDVL